MVTPDYGPTGGCDCGHTTKMDPPFFRDYGPTFYFPNIPTNCSTLARLPAPLVLFISKSNLIHQKKFLYSYKEDTTLTKIYFLRNSSHAYARMKLNDFFIKSLIYYWQRLIVAQHHKTAFNSRNNQTERGRGNSYQGATLI